MVPAVSHVLAAIGTAVAAARGRHASKRLGTSAMEYATYDLHMVTKHCEIQHLGKKIVAVDCILNQDLPARRLPPKDTD